jgi:pSer/pThr/pTyr-binding forkhead associated (FHA) protein
VSGREIRLYGVRGLVAGETFTVREGATVAVGRSRSCELSLARTAAYRRIGRAHLERNRAFRRISRRHLTIAYVSAERIVLRDTSTNGTRVDGSRVDEVVLTWDSLERRPVTIGIGEGEQLVLSCGSAPPPSGFRDELNTIREPQPSSSVSPMR